MTGTPLRSLQSPVNRLGVAGGLHSICHDPFPARMSETRLPILVVLHGEQSTPGRIGLQLRERGYALDLRRPRFGDELPSPLAGHAGAVVFGGPQSANDDDAVIRREIEWIGVPLKENKPYLGVCLGAQMLAKRLGARVYKHPDGHAEVGYYPIRPTAQGRAVCKDWPDQVYQWHREGFDLPASAALLAEGDSFPVQAFSYGGTAFALQFHVDVTHATMCRWTTRGHERMSLPNAKPRQAHFEDRLLHDSACKAWLAAFIDRWLETGAGSANGAAAQRRVSKVSTR
jgi:GMP synthase (glutamine-hydrolysing)